MAAKRPNAQDLEARRPQAEDLDAEMRRTKQESAGTVQTHRPRCPKCGAPDYRVTSSGPRRRSRHEPRVKSCRCRVCGAAFQLVED